MVVCVIVVFISICSCLRRMMICLPRRSMICCFFLLLIIDFCMIHLYRRWFGNLRFYAWCVNGLYSHVIALLCVYRLFCSSFNSYVDQYLHVKVADLRCLLVWRIILSNHLLPRMPHLYRMLFR